MIDNGLLMYYPKYADEFGRLKFSSLKRLDEKKVDGFLNNNFVAKSRLKKGFIFHKDTPFYYEKLYGSLNLLDRTRAEDKVDMEVLLSQIYANVGLDTAIYLPTINRNRVGVVSNNIVAPQVCTYFEFVSIMKKSNPNFKPNYDMFRKFKTKELMLESYFQKKPLEDFVLMHALDCACGNIDRHANNFFVSYERNENGVPVINGIKLFDYGDSETYINEESSRPDNIYSFCNGLGGPVKLSRPKLVDELKNNEFVNNIYTPVQLAKKIGEVDVFKTAEDVYQTTNYEIDSTLLDKLALCIDDTAEQLIK